MMYVNRINSRVYKITYNKVVWYVCKSLNGRMYAECPSLPNHFINKSNIKQVKTAIKNNDYKIVEGTGNLLTQLKNG